MFFLVSVKGAQTLHVQLYFHSRELKHLNCIFISHRWWLSTQRTRNASKRQVMTFTDTGHPIQTTVTLSIFHPSQIFRGHQLHSKSSRNHSPTLQIMNWMMLDGIGWYWIALDGIGWYCMVLNGIGWYWMVLSYYLMKKFTNQLIDHEWLVVHG